MIVLEATHWIIGIQICIPLHFASLLMVPCLNHFVFMVREDVLDLSVMIRSNDMYGAWPANVYALGELLTYVCEKTNQKQGTLTTLSVNAHIYKNDWTKAREV